MRKQMIVVVAMLMGLGMAPAAVSAAAISTKIVVPSEMIQGRVVGASGNALRDVLVSVTISGGTEQVLTTRTAADGSYKLALPVVRGTYTLRVLHIGYSPESIVFTRQNNAWTTPEQITMRPIESNAPQGAVFIIRQ